MKLSAAIVPGLVFLGAALVVQIGFFPTLAFFRPGEPAAPAEVVAASPAPAPVFATLSVPTVRFAKPAVEESLWEERFPSAAVAKIEPPSEAAPALVSASVVRQKPSQRLSRHCDQYNRPVAIPQRESILDDREAKLEAALVISNRLRIAYSRCKSKEQASPGG